MAHLRKIPYTKPIPPGAEIITRQGKRFARFKDDAGKTATAPLTKKGDRIRLLSSKWYGEYTDADGTPQCVPLSTNKTAAQQMLAELVRRVELGKANIRDPFEDHRKRPLAEHLADWERALRSEGDSEDHVRQTVAAVRRVLDGCRFVFAADVSASSVQEFVAGLRKRSRQAASLDPAKELYTKRELAALLNLKPCAIPPMVRRHRLEAVGKGKARRFPRATAEALLARRERGASIRTANFYLAACKHFFNWLVRDRRLPDNSLAHLSIGNVKLDRRHDRRPLSEEELRRLLGATWTSASSYRGLVLQP